MSFFLESIPSTAVYTGSFTIYWHGLFVAAAIAVTLVMAYTLAKQHRKRTGSFWAVAIAAILFGFQLSRAAYIYFSPTVFNGSVEAMLDLNSGGYSLVGALLGAVLGICIASKDRAADLDAAAVAGTFGIAVGRVGALFSGENVGPIVYSERWQGLPVSVFCAQEQEWRLALSVYEAAVGVVLFAVLCLFFSYSRKASTGVRRGDCALLFALIYGVVQSFFESLRADALFFNILGFVKFSEIVCILSAALALVIFSVRAVKGCGRVNGAHILCWAAAAIGLFAGIYAEFRVSSETMVGYYSMMALGLFMALASGLALYCMSCKKSAPLLIQN